MWEFFKRKILQATSAAASERQPQRRTSTTKFIEYRGPIGPNGEFRRYYSILNPDEVQALGGMPPEAIIGMRNDDDTFSAESFVAGTMFKHFLHESILEFVPALPAYREVAAQVSDGVLIVVDQRALVSPDTSPPKCKLGRLLGADTQGSSVTTSFEPDADPPGTRPVDPANYIGFFTVRDGKIDPRTYAPNPGYRLFIPDEMLVRLDPDIRDLMVQRLRERAEAGWS